MVLLASVSVFAAVLGLLLARPYPNKTQGYIMASVAVVSFVAHLFYPDGMGYVGHFITDLLTGFLGGHVVLRWFD